MDASSFSGMNMMRNPTAEVRIDGSGSSGINLRNQEIAGDTSHSREETVSKVTCILIYQCSSNYFKIF